MSSYFNLAIVALVVAVAFGILWRMGYLVRLSNFVAETREELRKCTWPSWGELKGSTAVVMISILVLGVFTTVVDFVILSVVRWIIS